MLEDLHCDTGDKSSN